MYKVDKPAHAPNRETLPLICSRVFPSDVREMRTALLWTIKNEILRVFIVSEVKLSLSSPLSSGRNVTKVTRGLIVLMYHQILRTYSHAG